MWSIENATLIILAANRCRWCNRRCASAIARFKGISVAKFNAQEAIVSFVIDARYTIALVVLLTI